MRLLAYMKQHLIDDDAMAAKIGEGVTPRAVRKWKYLETTPPLQRLLKIQKVTEGEVNPEDFSRSEPTPAPEPAGAAT